MQTKIISSTDSQSVNRAAELLRQDQLVAFPTETVYGLGARVFSPEAIHKIYHAKGRPSDNPLIAHIASWDHYHQLTEMWTDIVDKLASAFWPGPLTIVVPKKDQVPDQASAGLDTIGIRWPDHPTTQNLIQALDEPLVAPSANLSGKPSATNAQEVFNQLNGKISLILDSGNTTVGIESTVLDLSTHQPTILRPGDITQDQIEEILGKSIISASLYSQTPKSPGMKYRHYAPHAEIKVISTLAALPNKLSKNEWFVTYKKEYSKDNLVSRVFTQSSFYSLLHQADKSQVEIIWLLMSDNLQKNTGLWNRVQKAAGLL